MTQPDKQENTAADLQRRDLVMALLSLSQELGHFPNPEEIDTYSQFRYKRYEDEFGDLFNAAQAAGILPDEVTRSDFYNGRDATQSGPNANTESEHMSEQDVETIESPEEVDNDETNAGEKYLSGLNVGQPSSEELVPVDESDLIAEIQRFAAIIDEPPTQELVVTYGRHDSKAYRDQFNSWKDALETAGYDPDELPDWTRRSYTNVEILDSLRSVVDELGHTPTTSEAEEFVDFTPGLASLRFGSWQDALEVAEQDPVDRHSVALDSGEESKKESQEGKEYNTSSRTDISQPDSFEGDQSVDDSVARSTEIPESESSQEPSRQELVEELERLDDSLDRIPYLRDINENSPFTAHDYQGEFESWDTALEAAGIDKEAELLDELLRVTNKLGHKPTQQEMSEHGKYSFGMYADFFGSWTASKDRLEEWRSGQSSRSTEVEDHEVQQDKSGIEDDTNNEETSIGSIIDERLEEIMGADDDSQL